MHDLCKACCRMYGCQWTASCWERAGALRLRRAAWARGACTTACALLVNGPAFMSASMVLCINTFHEGLQGTDAALLPIPYF